MSRDVFDADTERSRRIKPDWGRLGVEIVSRRVALGMRTREEFAANVNLSYRSLSDLENGKRPFQRSTLAMIEQALDWWPGSAVAVLEGGSPRELQAPTETASTLCGACGAAADARLTPLESSDPIALCAHHLATYAVELLAAKHPAPHTR